MKDQGGGKTFGILPGLEIEKGEQRVVWLYEMLHGHSCGTVQHARVAGI